MTVAGAGGLEGKLRRLAFLPSNLNHTLHHALAARAAWGRGGGGSSTTDGGGGGTGAGASVVVVGTSIPVPGCSRFDAPLSPGEAVLVGAPHRRQIDTPMWLEYARLNQQARARARSPAHTLCEHATHTAQPYVGSSRRIPAALSQRHSYTQPRARLDPLSLFGARTHVCAQADWVVRQHGATFLDIAAMSAQRPDGAMARFWPSK